MFFNDENSRNHSKKQEEEINIFFKQKNLYLTTKATSWLPTKKKKKLKRKTFDFVVYMLCLELYKQEIKIAMFESFILYIIIIIVMLCRDQKSINDNRKKKF